MRRFTAILNGMKNLPLTTVWQVSSIMEAKGKQELWLQKRPETLTALRQQALIHSAESSNRIEGVTIPSERLRPLLLENARPRDRSEEELSGYRKALDWIFTKSAREPLTPRVVLHLHKLAQGGHSGDAGMWKARDNEMLERPRFRLLFGIYPISYFSALHIDYGMMSVFSRRRGSQAVNIFGVYGFQYLFEAER